MAPANLLKSLRDNWVLISAAAVILMSVGGAQYQIHDLSARQDKTDTYQIPVMAEKLRDHNTLLERQQSWNEKTYDKLGSMDAKLDVSIAEQRYIKEQVDDLRKAKK